MMRYPGYLMAGLALLSGPTMARAAGTPDEVDQRVEQMLETSRQVFSVQEPVRRCAQSDPNEIVVCIDRGRDQQVQSTAETDPGSLAARRFRDGNIPSAPQLDRGYCSGCPHFGWVPPPVYYVDVTALPAAPEGSDADRIAKGEMPAP